MSAVAVKAPTQPASPFKGLTPYTEDDAAFFFGRDDAIEIVIANLEARRLTLLYGDSGVGKSSLLRAGVVHRLRETARRNLKEIGTPEFVPVYFAAWSGEPLGALLEEIRAAVSALIGAPAHEAPTSGRLDEALERWSAQAEADVLVVLDQFEEYLAYPSGQGGDGTFATEFPRAINSPRLRARFVLSIREDMLARLDSFKHEIPTLFGTYLRVRHLDRASAEQAIRRPIEEYKRITADLEQQVEIAGGLVEAVLDQVTAGQVVLEQAGLGVGGEDGATAEERIETPYLQLVMTRLWNEEMKHRSRVLRVSTLNALGGAETIVRTHLDEALGVLPPAKQDAVADIFHFLVTPTGTKVAYSAPDLVAYTGRSDEEVESALNSLAGGEARIVRPVAAPPGQEGPPRWEIFHDVLGPAVLDWRTRYLHERLEREKNEARALADRERRRAWVYRAVAASALALLIALTVVFAIIQAGRANTARHKADSRLLAGESRDALDVSIGTGALLAAQADASADTFEARSAMLDALREAAGLRGFLHFGSAVDTMAADAASGRLAVALRNGNLVVRDRNGALAFRRKLGGLTSLAFRPDGRLLAAAKLTKPGESGRVLLLAPSAGQLPVVRTLKLPAGEMADGLTFSADGRWLSGNASFGVVLWDLHGSSRLPVRGWGGDSSFAALAFSPTDANVLATANDSGKMELWNVTRPQRPLRRLRSSGGEVHSITLSPDGRTLAGLSDDGKSVWLWRLDRGSTRPRRLANQPVSTMTFSPDGQTLVTGGQDRTVVLWNVSTAHQLGEPLRGFNNSVSSLVFDRRRNAIDVASLDGTVSVWNFAERARLAGRIGLQREAVSDVASNFGGKSLVALTEPGAGSPAHHGPRMVPRSTVAGRLLDLDLPGATAVAVSAAGRWLAARSSETSLWDLRGPRPKSRPTPPAVSRGDVTDLAFGSQGTVAAATGGGEILVWRVGERRLLAPPFGPRRKPSTIAFSPDGKLLAAGYWDSSGAGSVLLWHVPQSPRFTPNPRPITMPGGHRRPVLAVAFSPDGKTLASAGRDSTIKLWNVEGHRLLDTLVGHTGYVTGLAFSADGKMLASAGEDKTVQLWDVKERRRLGKPLLAGAPVKAVAFWPASHDSEAPMLAAVENGELKFWDASLWRLGPKTDLNRLRRRLCHAVGADPQACDAS